MKNIFKIFAVSTLTFALSACVTTESGLDGYTVSSTTAYQCGQDQISTTFLTKQHNNVALISVNGEAPILLANVISADGAKYQGGIYQLWTKGDKATFTNLLKAPKKNIQCKAVVSA